MGRKSKKGKITTEERVKSWEGKGDPQVKADGNGYFETPMSEYETKSLELLERIAKACEGLLNAREQGR
jgi:hypothetical protein